ncbi:MAG: amylo-alpha-1,6-glucosidase [Acidobacteriia bacterium]|nr:amylo-alpha-1,6-glucosidase [Terriglobia bacterium]
MPVNEAAALEEQHYILAPSDLPAERDFVLKQNDTFALFDRFGDLDSNSRGGEGLYEQGTRFLSCLKLKFANGRPLLLSSTVRRDNVLLGADLTNPDVYFEDRIFLHRGALHIYRSQFLWDQHLHQRIHIRNYSSAQTDISLTIEFRADYADIFEVRGTKREQRGMLLDPETGDGEVILGYIGRDSVMRRTVIRSATPPQVTYPGSMHYTLRLGPGEERCLDLSVSCRIGDSEPKPADYVHALSRATNAAEGAEHLMSPISGSNERFNSWLERSRTDLGMLLTANPEGLYPYAGVPWYATPFGRDGIITALECLWTAPAIARGVLGFLSAAQATEVSPAQDAEPGKILHEARDGEMAALGEIPFRRYYGSVDSTPLYLILAGEYFRRTGDLSFIRSIWPNLQRAIEWIDRYGDLDGDGFVEYQRKSENGLVQQGWKDSQDSVFHSDGRLAQGPIALCEVQGYVYAAKLEMAAVAATMGDHDTAQRLMQDAHTLQVKFDEAFWSDEIGMYALALDGEKRRCEVRTSNAGHCLFTGIATPKRAALVADHLSNERFCSGWGIRTVADSEARYNPMSYHNGSVWPHDNALIAAGFARYRMTHRAAKVLTGLFEVAREFDFNRLPELFCGFPRRPGKGPTLYPVACSPQAWAAAAAFYLLQSSIGLHIDARSSRITLVRPVLPEFLEQLSIRDIRVNGSTVDLLLFRSGNAVAVTVGRRTGNNVDVVVLQ